MSGGHIEDVGRVARYDANIVVPFLFGEYDQWVEVKDGYPVLRTFLARHYSARHYRDKPESSLTCGPGEKMPLVSVDGKAVFIWRKFISMRDEAGVNCAMFRNESEFLSSELIAAAQLRAWKRWPGERLYTYVNPRKIKSSNPGFCFQKAGWRKCGTTKGNLQILEIFP